MQDACTQTDGLWTVKVTDIYGRTATASLKTVESASAKLVNLVDGNNRGTSYSIDIPLHPQWYGTQYTWERPISYGYLVQGANPVGGVEFCNSLSPCDINQDTNWVDLTNFPTPGSGGWSTTCNQFDYTANNYLHGDTQARTAYTRVLTRSGKHLGCNLTFNKAGLNLYAQAGLSSANGTWQTATHNYNLSGHAANGWIHFAFELFGNAADRTYNPHVAGNQAGPWTDIVQMCNGTHYPANPYCRWESNGPGTANRFIFGRTFPSGEGASTTYLRMRDTEGEYAMITFLFSGAVP
jgi:hypothetical protein